MTSARTSVPQARSECSPFGPNPCQQLQSEIEEEQMKVAIIMTTMWVHTMTVEILLQMQPKSQRPQVILRRLTWGMAQSCHIPIEHRWNRRSHEFRCRPLSA